MSTIVQARGRVTARAGAEKQGRNTSLLGAGPLWSPIPRPRARVATGTLGADAKTARQTARPALELAGGALYLPQAPLATATRNSLGHSFARPHTSGCAGTQPGGRVIHLSTGAAEAGRLGGRRPVLTIFSPSL